MISLSHVGIKTSHNDEPRRHPLPPGPPSVPSLPCISLFCLLRFHLASTSSPVFLTLADSWLCLHREESCFPQGYSDAGCLGTFAPVLWGHFRPQRLQLDSDHLPRSKIHTRRCPQLCFIIFINCHHPPGESRKKQFSPPSSERTNYISPAPRHPRTTFRLSLRSLLATVHVTHWRGSVLLLKCSQNAECCFWKYWSLSGPHSPTKTSLPYTQR